MKLTYDQLLTKMRGDLTATVQSSVKDTVSAEVKAAVAAVLAEMKAAQAAGNPEKGIAAGLAAGLIPDPLLDPRQTQGKGVEYNPKHALARIVRSLAVGRGDPERALRYCKNAYGSDDPATRGLERAGTATKFHALSKAPQLASDLELGGVFIEPDILGDWIELLRPTSAVLSLNPTMIDMPSGTVSIPRQTGATSASYVGEASNLPVTNVTFGALQLSAKKLGAIVPISNDLLRFNSVVNDAMVVADLTRTINLAADLKAIRGLGTQHAPRGLRYWAASANVVASTSTDSTPTIAEITTDLEAPRYLLRNGNVNMVRPGWIFSPRTERVLRATRAATGSAFLWKDEMDRGTLLGYPYRVTTQIPDNLGGSSDESEIYFADFSEVIWGSVGGILVATSTEASYTESGVTRSSFQQDCTLVRTMMLHDLGVRQEVAVVVITGVKWATAPSS